MLFRSVENSIVPDTLPRTVVALGEWSPQDSELPPEPVFEDIDERWDEAGFWRILMAVRDAADADTALLEAQRARLAALTGDKMDGDAGFVPSRRVSEVLPETTAAYTAFALAPRLVDEDDVREEEPWEAVHAALARDLRRPRPRRRRWPDTTGQGPARSRPRTPRWTRRPSPTSAPLFLEGDADWGDPGVRSTIKQLSGDCTSSYFLSAVDMERLPSGEVVDKMEFEQFYIFLFERTLFLSVTITFTCLMLGYPIAWLLSNLPVRPSNLVLILVLILVLLPFWTLLLVRTSSGVVLVQQHGVVNDTLVSRGIVGDAGRLERMFDQTGTIVATTHILLPFMILPLYSVMKTIPPSYVRAAKSLGATDWTAFWRVYFPSTIPGIGAGAILVFILSIGYYTNGLGR